MVRQKRPKGLVTGYFGDRRSKEFSSTFYVDTLVLETTPGDHEWGAESPAIEMDYDEVFIRCSRETIYLKLLSTDLEEEY